MEQRRLSRVLSREPAAQAFDLGVGWTEGARALRRGDSASLCLTWPLPPPLPSGLRVHLLSPLNQKALPWLQNVP